MKGVVPKKVGKNTETDWVMFKGLEVEPDDMILITNPRGKKITIENVYGLLDFHGHYVKDVKGPAMRAEDPASGGVFSI